MDLSALTDFNLVAANGGLQGIVSLSDVVKNRIDELEAERAALTDYIRGVH